jgi:hypothetical protein
MKAGFGLKPSRARSDFAACCASFVENAAGLIRRPLPFPTSDTSREQNHAGTSLS